MFILFSVRDNVRIAPTHFLSEWGPALHDEIDARYANRVIPGVGLVVCCADVLHCGDAVLPAGDGAAFADGARPSASACPRPLLSPLTRPLLPSFSPTPPTRQSSSGCSSSGRCPRSCCAGA